MVKSGAVKSRGESRNEREARRGKAALAGQYANHHGGIATRKHITVTVTVRDDLLLSEDPLGEVVRDAARGVLRVAVEAEFSDYPETEDRRDGQGRWQVARGGTTRSARS